MDRPPPGPAPAEGAAEERADALAFLAFLLPPGSPPPAPLPRAEGAGPVGLIDDGWALIGGLDGGCVPGDPAEPGPWLRFAGEDDLEELPDHAIAPLSANDEPAGDESEERAA